MKVTYFAVSNLDVAISKDKKKVRRFAKRNLRFAGSKLQLGCCNTRVFSTPSSYREEFGICLIYDIDQALVFRPDFSIAHRL